MNIKQVKRMTFGELLDTGDVTVLYRNHVPYYVSEGARETIVSFDGSVEFTYTDDEIVHYDEARSIITFNTGEVFYLLHHEEENFFYFHPELDGHVEYTDFETHREEYELSQLFGADGWVFRDPSRKEWFVVNSSGNYFTITHMPKVRGESSSINNSTLEDKVKVLEERIKQLEQVNTKSTCCHR